MLKYIKLTQIIDQWLQLFEMCSSWGQWMHSEAEDTWCVEHTWIHLHSATSQLSKRLDAEKHFLASHSFHLNHKPPDTQWERGSWLGRAHLKEKQLLQMTVPSQFLPTSGYVSSYSTHTMTTWQIRNTASVLDGRGMTECRLLVGMKLGHIADGRGEDLVQRCHWQGLSSDE